MNLKTNTTVNKTSASNAFFSNSILQRKCACGNKTIADGECSKCTEKKNKLQRKLNIGASNDSLEKEADRIADQVMTMPVNPNIASVPLRIQRITNQPVDTVNTVPASVGHTLAKSGSPLKSGLRQNMEQRFGHDFSRVRIHTGGTAEQSSQEINAKAYTVGHNIVFNAKEYKPDTSQGQKLIAHELTHVIQQNSMPSNHKLLNKKNGKTKKKTTQFAAKDIAEFKFEPSVNGTPCACLVFVHNNEKSAKKIAGLMHQHCRYNFASVQTSGRCIPMPGEPAKGSCKKGSIDPNELFPKEVAEKCANDNKTCHDFVDKNKNSTDAAVIKEVAQHKYFLAISDCSKNFTLPVVALHNNDINDTKTFQSELKKKRPKPGSTNKKEIEKGKKFEKLLNKLKVDIDKTADAKKKPGSDNLNDLKEILKKEFKATDKSILFGQRGKTNIFRWCASHELSKCHVGDPENPDNVVWTTNENDFKTLSKKSINVVLQAKPTSTTKGKSKKGESDTDLSTLFLFMEQVLNEQITKVTESLTKNIQNDINDIIQIIQKLKNLAKYDDLLLADMLNGVITILHKIMEIIGEILILLGVITGGSIRINKLRFINIETGGKRVDPKKDPVKFDFIINVLEPLGLNCCDKEKEVKNELRPKE